MSKHQMWANKPQTCEQCGAHFESVRYNAVYCSARCRMAHKRAIARIQVLKMKALDAIEELVKYADKDGQGDAFRAACEVMQRAKSVYLFLEE